MITKLLEIRNLKTLFITPESTVRAVDGVSLELYEGEILGIVGESGSGKSVTSLSILRLIQSPPGKIVSGEIIYKGNDLLKYTEEQMGSIRGREIAMIFQEPMTSLNPVFTVGKQIAEVYITHKKMGRKEAWDAALEMLKQVKIPSPEQRINEYPHQLSGGMRQRVMIAMALALKPSLIIADEPTTALDVTVQAQILELMKDLKEEFNSSIMIITHDMGIIAGFADRVAVMYAGQLVEMATVEEIFAHPIHPYTRGLLNSIPKITDPPFSKLRTIDGSVPNPDDYPTGCRFHPRCKYAIDRCRTEMPELLNISKGHDSRCHLSKEIMKEDLHA